MIDLRLLGQPNARKHRQQRNRDCVTKITDQMTGLSDYGSGKNWGDYP
jgi:hypothetical protein